MIERLGSDSLLIIPCCASKALAGTRLASHDDPMAEHASDAAIRQVLEARSLALRHVRNDHHFLSGKYAKNTEVHDGPDFGGNAVGGQYLCALDRYQGTLYTVPGLRTVIESTLLRNDAPDILILSALYGPLHPLSPIQNYNLMMGERPARVWDQVFPLFLEGWVRNNGTKEIYLFVGTSTAYYRVARKAVSRLVDKRLITKAVQFHVVDGSTRETPLQHGRLLHALLTGQSVTTQAIQVNRIDGMAHQGGLADLRRHVPSTASGPAPAIQARMPLAPPMAARQPEADGAPAALPATAPAAQSLPRTSSTVRVTSDLDADTARFHYLLGKLIGLPMQGLPLSQLGTLHDMPARGVYFFLNKPYTDPRAQGWRVVRVGTHAVGVGSKSTLRQRLRAHLGNRAGMGNHRGSIFRLHIGNAFLQRGGRSLPTWGVGSVAPSTLKASPELQRGEEALERQVSKYIGSLGVLWIEVPDEPGPLSERALIERNAIALLSNQRKPIAAVDAEWLGGFSTREEIRGSLLWNLKHVDEHYDPAFLDSLERAVERTINRS